ncbi:citrate synthase I [Enterobacter cloacae]|uniref:Citrate synthase I n=1 Tax=Enterobacter cloacae TaxID=550 RepID=A0A377M3V9_ENTCL|nr:citrate synthase I [Enterobacter cloacae]
MADTKAKLTLNGGDAIELDVLKGTLVRMLLISVRWVPKECSPLTLDYLYRILRIQNHLH